MMPEDNSQQDPMAAFFQSFFPPQQDQGEGGPSRQQVIRWVDGANYATEEDARQIAREESLGEGEVVEIVSQTSGDDSGVGISEGMARRIAENVVSDAQAGGGLSESEVRGIAENVVSDAQVISSIESDIDALNGDINDVAGALNEYPTPSGIMTQDDKQELQSQIDSLDDQLTALKNRPDDPGGGQPPQPSPTPPEKYRYEDDIANIQDDLTALENEVSALGIPDITGLETELDNIESRISDLEDQGDGTPVNTPPDPPIPTSPRHRMTGTPTDVTLRAEVSDPDGDRMSVIFKDGNGNKIGRADGVRDGGMAKVRWSGLKPGTTYRWYAVADDGKARTKGDETSFTTEGGSDEPKPINGDLDQQQELPSPTNGDDDQQDDDDSNGAIAPIDKQTEWKRI